MLGHKLYEVVRFAQNRPQRVIKRNLTLSEVQKICSDPETSSMTANNACHGDPYIQENWHKKQQHWFYGYRSQEDK